MVENFEKMYVTEKLLLYYTVKLEGKDQGDNLNYLKSIRRSANDLLNNNKPYDYPNQLLKLFEKLRINV